MAEVFGRGDAVADTLLQVLDVRKTAVLRA
jgi:hypothetical protein